MKFNTYIINLNKDKNKLKKIKLDLNDKKMKHIRFSAITGSKIKKSHKKYITKRGRDILPKNLLGQGLSHILLNKHIYEKDENKIAVVLEDNIKILYEKIDIEDIILKAPKDWEYITLNCKGICKYKKNNWDIDVNASMAGYIINKKGALKISKMKLYTYIDLQLNKEKIKIYKSPKRLIELKNFNITTYNRSKIYGGFILDFLPKEKNMNSKVSHYLSYSVLKIPYINKSLSLVSSYILFSFIMSLLLIFLIFFNGSWEKKLIYLIIIFLIIFVVLIIVSQKMIKKYYKNINKP